MNRFALIPLAILANACASQADLEAMAEVSSDKEKGVAAVMTDEDDNGEDGEAEEGRLRVA